MRLFNKTRIVITLLKIDINQNQSEILLQNKNMVNPTKLNTRINDKLRSMIDFDCFMLVAKL